MFCDDFYNIWAILMKFGAPYPEKNYFKII